MNNLPRLGIKRAFEKIIVDEMNLEYVESAFTTGVTESVQVGIPMMQEEYERIAMQSKLKTTLSVTFEIFSEVNETGVHKAAYDIFNITAIHPLLKEFKINRIYPISSSTSYNDESSDGHVIVQVVLNLEYFM
ncbi:TPA: hypothetical protein MM329_000680 [Escherichia coli]|nr:hypothetical protein [Escherichia coli]HBZ8229046.1 hypothetical protein [Escherichia coli]HBZ8345774.1 hypothetical protein [Escherichia coli]HBZ8350843.1 hypothetical protein [Escherichia coli]HBZ8356175.1 hypothetical protein [Escherichia coli]